MPTLRVMTYNIRSCIDTRRRHNPEGVADIIKQYSPDIVALQEVDSGFRHYQGVDQAEIIADTLSMNYHFHPSIKVEEGGYGNAVISKFPLRKIKTLPLPEVEGLEKTLIEKILNAEHEPRGALWVQADVEGLPVQVITTHLGLTRQERCRQLALFEEFSWYKEPESSGRVLFCGDFNESHRSSVYRSITQAAGFSDAQRDTRGHKRRGTFFSRWPLFCLDHIFFKGELSVRTCEVVKNRMTVRQSDHLPVVAEFEL